MTIARVKIAGFAINEKPTSSQLNQIDADHVRACDRTIAGDTISGIVVVGGSTSVITFSGGAKAQIANAGALYDVQSTGSIVLGDNDYPTYSASRPLVRCAPFVAQQRGNLFWLVTNNQSTSGAPGLVGATDLTNYLVDGATLASLDVFFAVGSPHVGVPATMPSFILYKLAYAASITAMASGTVPTAASSTAWYASGATQTINIAVGAVIDRTAYSYFLQVTDESSTNSLAGNIYQSVRLNMTGIADMRPA